MSDDGFLFPPTFAELGYAHFASLLIHTWQVDLRYELNGGWDVGIVIATMDVEAIDTVLVGTLAQSCSVRSVAEGIGAPREAVPGSFRSSWTSRGHPHLIIRTSMPLPRNLSFQAFAAPPVLPTGSQSFLAFLELLKQAKVAGNFRCHRSFSTRSKW